MAKRRENISAVDWAAAYEVVLTDCMDLFLDEDGELRSPTGRSMAGIFALLEAASVCTEEAERKDTGINTAAAWYPAEQLPSPAGGVSRVGAPVPILFVCRPGRRRRGGVMT